MNICLVSANDVMEHFLILRFQATQTLPPMTKAHFHVLFMKGCCVYSSSMKQCLPSVNHEQFPMQMTHKHKNWLQILAQEDFPPRFLWSENANLKFSVNNEPSFARVIARYACLVIYERDTVVVVVNSTCSFQSETKTSKNKQFIIDLRQWQVKNTQERTCKKRKVNTYLWVDSFATYAYSCRICPLEFFIVLDVKIIKYSSGQMRRLYAYVANESTHNYTYLSRWKRFWKVYMYIISLPLFEWRNTATPLESFSTARLWLNVLVGLENSGNSKRYLNARAVAKILPVTMALGDSLME